MRNQSSDNSPAMGNSQISQGYFLLRRKYLPVFGQTEKMFLAFLNSISTPP
jgi:hypothetical protein